MQTFRNKSTYSYAIMDKLILSIYLKMCKNILSKALRFFILISSKVLSKFIGFFKLYWKYFYNSFTHSSFQ